MAERFASVPDVLRAPARRRLSRRHEHRRRRVPRRPARQAGARRRARRASARPSSPRPRPRSPNARLIRLQCYEGLDESKAIYEWNYKKQLLRIQADREHERDWETVEADIFSEQFLLTRPLLEAIRADDPVVLLIDEVDRVEIETEALLLEVLSDFQVSIPELGTIEGKQRPLVFLTSNNTRELSEALKRRCLFLHIDYPDVEREKEIVRVRVPEVDDALAEQIAKVVGSIRNIDLKKAPSISETIDWARTLVYLGRNEITPEVMGETLHVLLKYQTDITKARKELGVDAPATPARR